MNGSRLKLIRKQLTLKTKELWLWEYTHATPKLALVREAHKMAAAVVLFGRLLTVTSVNPVTAKVSAPSNIIT